MKVKLLISLLETSSPVSMGTITAQGFASRCSLSLMKKTLNQIVEVNEVSYEGRPGGLRKWRCFMHKCCHVLRQQSSEKKKVMGGGFTS